MQTVTEAAPRTQPPRMTQADREVVVRLALRHVIDDFHVNRDLGSGCVILDVGRGYSGGDLLPLLRDLGQVGYRTPSVVDMQGVRWQITVSKVAS